MKRFEEQLSRVEQQSLRARELVAEGTYDEVRVVLADVRVAIVNLAFAITTEEQRRRLRKLKRKHARFLRVVARTDKSILH